MDFSLDDLRTKMDIRLPKIPNPPRMGIKCLSKVEVKVFILLTGQDEQFGNERLSIFELVRINDRATPLTTDWAVQHVSIIFLSH